MKKAFILLYFPIILFAQEASKTKKPWLIKLAPLAYLDIDNTLQFASEQMISPTWSIQEEFGYGNTQMSLSSNTYSNYKETYRARFEARHYKNYGYGEPIGNYWAFEGLFKQVNEEKSFTVGRECTNGWQCAYQETIDGIRAKQVLGGHVKFGRQIYIKSSGQNTRFVFDFYAGIGARNINIRNTSYEKRENDMFWEFRDYGFERRSGNYRSISGTMGLKIGYKLN
jgi:hypothetical protein